MLLRIILCAVLAIGVATSAAANDKSKNENKSSANAASQSVKAESSDSANVDDSMTDFMAAVDDVLVDDTDPDGQGNEERTSGHEKHLGLGFAHGMSNDKGGRPDSGDNPHNDNCNGNGHTGNPNGNGKSKGKGHESWGNGNGFGHRDCGEPSPAD